LAEHHEAILESLRGSIFQFYEGSDEVRKHVLIPDRSCCCVVCEAETASLHLATPTDQRSADHTISIGGEHHEFGELDSAHLDCLVSNLVGIVGDIIEIQVLPKLYISIGSVAPPLAQCLAPIVAEGRGVTLEQARVTCLGEAAERYSCFFAGDEQRLVSSFSKLQDTAIHPNELMLFSDSQYARGGCDQMYIGTAALVPTEFDDFAKIEWTEATSCDSRERVFIPTSYCYFGYSNLDHPAFCFPDSNGCAAGRTLAEAKLGAVLELVERDACAIWWYNRIVRSNIELHSLESNLASDWLAVFRVSGRSLTVLDITSDLGIPVFAAISANACGADVRIGLGCNPEPTTAAVRAVGELVQQMWGSTWDRQQHQMQGGFFANAGSEWNRLVNLSNSPHLSPTGSYPIDQVQKGLPRAKMSIERSNDELLGRLNDAGLRAYFVDLTRDDIQVPCVRAIVPGLRHFWRRMAPGRLYDVPVRMRWLSDPMSEDDMNPITLILAR
jgi:ribosomal protein S12 methylthiotransferase accessory factor